MRESVHAITKLAHFWSPCHTKDTTPLFHGPWHDPVGEHICAQPFRMWDRLRFHRSHKYFRDAKALQINRILVVLAWTDDELSRGQAQNGVNFDFKVKFDLEGQSQSPTKTMGIVTKVLYTYGPNLAWTGDELSRGQACDYFTQTDGHIDRQMQATKMVVYTDSQN